MAYGFKVLDPSGAVICDGTSEMLRLHAVGSIYVGANSSATFYFPAIAKQPAVSIQTTSFPTIYRVSFVKDANGNYNGVSYYNGGSSGLTAYMVVLRR